MARIILTLFPYNTHVEDGKPHRHFPHLEDGDSHPSRALCGSLHQDVRVVHAPEQPEFSLHIIFTVMRRSFEEGGDRKNSPL